VTGACDDAPEADGGGGSEAGGGTEAGGGELEADDVAVPDGVPGEGGEKEPGGADGVAVPDGVASADDPGGVTAAPAGVRPAGLDVGAEPALVPTDAGTGVDVPPEDEVVVAGAHPPRRMAAQVAARRSFMARECAASLVTGR